MIFLNLTLHNCSVCLLSSFDAYFENSKHLLTVAVYLVVALAALLCSLTLSECFAIPGILPKPSDRFLPLQSHSDKKRPEPVTLCLQAYQAPGWSGTSDPGSVGGVNSTRYRATELFCVSAPSDTILTSALTQAGHCWRHYLDPVNETPTANSISFGCWRVSTVRGRPLVKLNAPQ